MTILIWFLIYILGVVATFGIFNLFTRNNEEIYEGAGPIIAIFAMTSWIGFIFVCALKLYGIIEDKF